MILKILIKKPHTTNMLINNLETGLSSPLKIEDVIQQLIKEKLIYQKENKIFLR